MTSSISQIDPEAGRRSLFRGVRDPNRAGSGRFRSDIEGMRAIAILLIVAYHAGLPGFTGGFIGVDIFFVISGFLITRNLLEESSTKNSIVLSRFWARRVRRLVPGLALMVIATLIASSLIVAPFDMLEISKEGASASLYVSNIVFGFKAQNYFASNINKSPFLHTWSLGVEEQFYLVWPFVLYAALLLSRRTGIFVRRLAVPFFAVILAISFAVNVVLTDRGSSWAFFSLPTRAWEFALGGLIAAMAVRKLPARWSLLLGVTGLAAIAYADLAFNDATPYPGPNAVWPVAGVGLLILAGQMVDPSRATVIMRTLGTRPMRWVGRLSYSWYLWHWPFIILAVLAIGNDSVTVRTGAALVSLGVAYIAYRLVENRLRFSERTDSIFAENLSGWAGDYWGDAGHGWRGLGDRHPKHASLICSASICCPQGVLSEVHFCYHSPRHLLLCRWRPE